VKGRKVPENTAARMLINKKTVVLTKVHRMISLSEKRRAAASAAMQNIPKGISLFMVKGKSTAHTGLRSAQPTNRISVHPRRLSV
jgi:hypothetical protein